MGLVSKKQNRKQEDGNKDKEVDHFWVVTKSEMEGEIIMSYLKPTPELNEILSCQIYLWSSSSMDWPQASPRHLVDPPIGGS